MSVLWCGGEDVDFIEAVNVVTTSLRYRSAYGVRCGLYSASGVARSKAFPDGAVSAGSFGARVYFQAVNINAIAFGPGNASQLRFLMAGVTNLGILTLYKRDGSTSTSLATEAGVSLPSNAITQIDIQVIQLGASGHAKVYLNGSAAASIDYSGDLSWINNVDCMGIGNNTAVVNSELIATNDDTRPLSLGTIPVSGAGDSNAWNGSSADVDEISINDADVLYTDGISNEVLLSLGDSPSGNFSVRAVREVARVAKSVSGTATQISLGVKSGGTTNVDSAHSLDTAFSSIDRLMTVNPVTGLGFTKSEIDALQLALRSA